MVMSGTTVILRDRNPFEVFSTNQLTCPNIGSVDHLACFVNLDLQIDLLQLVPEESDFFGKILCIIHGQN